MTIHRTTWTAVLGLAAALGTGTGTLQAQSSGDGFLFKPPRVTWSFRGGYALASASSDIFSFSTTQLTLRHRDFNAPTFGSDLAIRLTKRVDVTVGFSWAGEKAGSEFRNW